ncbi:MAG: hypothetical protein FJX70_04020 [Alphaproteobacteria bacterium]|nr:hypothetical protein [Alphaproteobacteria bacterium]
MGTRAADYTEYIDITTSTVRRKRTGMLLRDSEDIFIVDPNISIPKNKQTNFLSKIQNDLTINSEKPYYFAKTSLQPISEPSTEQLEYFTNAENFSLSPTNTLAPITFLKSKAKLPEDKQLIVKNNDSLTDEAIITVESSEIVVITEKDIDQSSQILESQSDLGEENGIQDLKTEIEIQIPTKVNKEIIGYEGENLLQDQLEQRLEEQRLEEQRLERERIAREEGERVRQQKLKEYYDKHNAEVLARTERQKQEEERQKQERLQKFKKYHEQQVRKILFQLERQKKLEKQRLEREELEKLKAKSLLDELKEGIVLLELAQKQAAKKLLPAGVFFKNIRLCAKQKTN